MPTSIKKRPRRAFSAPLKGLDVFERIGRARVQGDDEFAVLDCSVAAA